MSSSAGLDAECLTLADFKSFLRIETPEDLDQLGDHPCPSRLVACAQTRTIVPMEVFIEENVIPPVGIALELLRSTP